MIPTNNTRIANLVYQNLNDLSIDFLIYEHPTVKTVEEAIHHWKDIPATHCKNLFLRDNPGRRHFLIVMEHDKVFNIKMFGKQSNIGRLSFASEKRLNKYLNLQPGAVSPFGLINDQDNHVEVYVDQNLKNALRLGFHPNINTSTITISASDFDKFLVWTGNSFSYFDL
jgi:Ala-tRNA(Pro) deacylase